MGVVTGLAPCFVCARPFTFNPYRVPAFCGEPVCAACMDAVNRRRVAVYGLPAHPIAPDAYEPLDEREL